MYKIDFNMDEDGKVTTNQKEVEELQTSQEDIQIVVKNNHNELTIVMNCKFEEIQNIINPFFLPIINTTLQIP